MRALQRGEVVAFPTETYYGLGVPALDAAAVDRLVRMKARDPDKPIPVLVADRTMLERIARVPPEAEPWIQRYWPGPLTLVLPAAAGLPPPLCSAAGEIGVRISSHPLARELVERLGAPITATSANRAGEPPARTAAQVRAAFSDRLVLDGGETAGGPPSTVVRIYQGRAIVLRQGAVQIPWPR